MFENKKNMFSNLTKEQIAKSINEAIEKIMTQKNCNSIGNGNGHPFDNDDYGYINVFASSSCNINTYEFTFCDAEQNIYIECWGDECESKKTIQQHTLQHAETIEKLIEYATDFIYKKIQESVGNYYVEMM